MSVLKKVYEEIAKGETCGKRVVIAKGKETYCRYHVGHEGSCEPSGNFQFFPAVKPIPCSCLDCKTKASKREETKKA